MPFLNNRKSFRPAYGKLDLLTSIFSKTPIIGLTATATKQMKQKIVEAMGIISPFVIDVNPDRKNIYFSSSRRDNQGDEKLGLQLGVTVHEFMLISICQCLSHLMIVSWSHVFIGFVVSVVSWFHRFRGVNSFIVS